MLRITLIVHLTILMVSSQVRANFELDTSRVQVEGLCGQCKDRIEDAVLSTDGVIWADWNEANRTLAYTAASTFQLSDLKQNLFSSGHDSDLGEASDEAYTDLPLCCKYRDFETHEAVMEFARELAEKNKNASKSSKANEQHINGMIYGKEENGREDPLIGANVYWLNETSGTSTDEEGHFHIDKSGNNRYLVISYVGYGTDTIDMEGQQKVVLMMYPENVLETVNVTYRKRATEVSFIDPIKTFNIDEKELLKAACCNLSESFETNPTVDVSFTDAVTGTRQIQMLGLAGPYVQLTRENIPEIRGLAALYGFTFTPGPWVQSIQLNMGAGSVVNGFESITGQINTELRKPETSDALYLNVYGNVGGRMEANLNLAQKISDKVSTGLLLHGSLRQSEWDRNDDGFLDMPKNESLIALNRWKFEGNNGWRGQLGVKGTIVNQLSGQKGFDNAGRLDSRMFWGSEVQTDRLDVWGKLGRVFPDKPYASIGLQVAASFHDQEAYFGFRNYDAAQNSLYGNLIYQSIIGSTTHQYRAGLSFQYDDVEEVVEQTEFLRSESVLGGFFEYTFTPSHQFSLVAGIRADHHNNFGSFLTPRLHLRYALRDDFVWRIAIGRGARTASIFAENIGLFASSRNIVLAPQSASNSPYGLDQEVAWNYGINVQKDFLLGERLLSLGVDYYYTNFLNQIVIDWDQNPQEIHFYNLEGKSYSHAFMAQIDYELISRFDIRLAYRFNDVQTDYQSGRLLKPLVARHRAFANLAYHTNDQWHFDVTVNLIGEKRIPNTTSNPEDFQLDGFSPSFGQVNGQISKQWQENFEIYIGVENALDFRQSDPILANRDPFSDYFDSSLVWGPIFGRNFYAGLRYRI